MERIAFVSGGTFIYWESIVLVAAVAVACCFFLSFYLGKTGNAAAGFAALPLAIALSLVFARFFHWYCRSDSYSGFLAAMTDYSTGGFALMGVFLGCYLTAVLLRAVRLSGNLQEMLDSMCLGGAAGIAVGRLASFFTSADRGQVMQKLRTLPFAYPVTNVVSGATEYRLATFLFQALVALVLFLLLAGFYRRSGGAPAGDTCKIFLLCYCASQAVLDSTRYDSLFSRSNGFVSVVQVLSAVAVVGVTVSFSRRLVKNRGFAFWYVLLWILQLAALGGAGYMEYYVQRHGSEALLAYSVMSLCMALTAGITLLIRGVAQAYSGKNRNFVG